MSDSDSSESKSIFRTEGVILIFFTAAAYAAFLIREMGYADFFSIPQELIVTSHVGLVATAQALLLGAMAYVGKVNLIWIFAPRGEGFLYFFLRFFIATILVVGFALYPYLMTDLSWWFFGVIVGILVFGWLLWPLITQRKVRGYENKLAEQIKLERNYETIYDTFFGKIERSARFPIVFIIAILIFAYGDGRKNAIEQESFNMIVDEPDVAVLRIYGEVIVAATLDIKARKLKGKIKIQKMAEGKWLDIRPTKIGRIFK